MKVAFLFGGLPHYYVLLLNKMNQLQEVEVMVYYPENKNTLSIGKSVFQDKSLCEFETRALPEAAGLFGKVKVTGLDEAVRADRPDILIVCWPYSLSIFADFKLLWLLERLNIKLVEKSIPYQIPKLQEAYRYYRNIENIMDESLRPLGKKGLFTDIKYSFLTLFRKYQFNRADGHVCYIPQAKEILGSYGVPEEKIYIILNSPITNNFLKAADDIKGEPDILPRNDYRIVHLGRLVKWKKVHLLIEAVRLLRENFETIELLVIGDGPELNNLKQQAEEAGLSGNVKFTGSLYDPKEIARYMKCSAVYVLAGTGGLSINDAMCFGKPIICSTCDGTEKFLVRDGQNGYFFKTDDVNDLAVQLEKLLGNEEKIKSMGEESLRIVKEEVNEDIVISNYIRAFHKILEK